MATTSTGSYRATDRGDTRTGVRRSPRTAFTESKLGVKTSEFYMMLLFIAGTLIAAYVSSDDGFAREDAWRYSAWVAAAYIVSRGLAKLGTREPYDRDDRD